MLQLPKMGSFFTQLRFQVSLCQMHRQSWPWWVQAERPSWWSSMFQLWRSHTASHRKCPAYITYAEKIKQTSSLRLKIQPQQRVTLLPTLNAVNFPSLVPTVSQVIFPKPRLDEAILAADRLIDAVEKDSLLEKLSQARERPHRIPHIQRAIERFCQFTDELEKSTNFTQTWNIFTKYFLATRQPNA